MFDGKLIERQKTFSKDKSLSQNNNTNSLIRKREEMNLELRKNKLFDRIFERRLNCLNSSNSRSGDNNIKNISESNSKILDKNLSNSIPVHKFEIEINNLKIPDILKINYIKHPDKLSVIVQLLNENENSEGNSNSNIDIIKFAIVSLRKFLCEKKEKLSKDEITNIYNNIYNHLLYYLLDYKNENETSEEELKIKYETSWIIINLTSESEKFCEGLLDVKNLIRLDEILQELIDTNNNNNFNTKFKKTSTNDVIRHILWIFSNLLAEDSQYNKIIRNTIKLEDRFDYFFTNTEYVNNLNNPDTRNVIQVLLWMSANFLRYIFSDAKYIHKNLLIHVINIMKYASVNSENNSCIDIVRDCLETLIYFTNCEALIPIFIENDAVPVLINAFSLVSSNHNDQNINSNSNQIYEDIFNIVKLLSELLTVEDKLINKILEYPVIEKFLEILVSINSNHTTMLIEDSHNYENDSKILKEVCLAISNITASTHENIEKIILNEKMVENLLNIYEKFGNSVKYEIYHIFFNAFHGGNSYIRSQIIRRNIHRLYIDKFNEIYISEKNMTKTTSKIIKVILDSFLIFLEFGEKNMTKINFIKVEMENGNVVALLEKLQFSQNSELYEVAHKLLIRYWTEDECYYEDPSDLN